MLNDSEFVTLRNRFKRDAELLMQTAASGDEDEKSKIQKHCVCCRYFPKRGCALIALTGSRLG